MEEQEQKQRERAHLEAFRRACPDFPQGPIDPIDERKEKGPDFVVKASDHVVGIEHTDFHWDETTRGSPLRTAESLQDEVVRSAARLYGTRNLPKTQLRVHWRPSDGGISRRRRQQLPKEIADVVEHYLPIEGKHVLIAHPHDGWPSLPAEIISLLIGRLGEPTENGWISTRSGWVPQVGLAHLERRIAEKECRLDAYRSRCDEVWLLIVADGRAPSSFGEFAEAVRRQEFHSAFDRLFFFRYFDGDCVELRRKSG